MATGVASTAFLSVPGVRLAAVPSGIKASGDLDLALIEFSAGSQTAAVFTQSHFAAAPVHLARAHLAKAAPRYFLINSGNANAATGAEGMADAQACCQALAKQAGTEPEAVLPFSTGVIGERLPTAPILASLPLALAGLAEDNWLQAAKGIMTTDTRPKIASRQFSAQGKTVTLTGIAKGAGMIAPKMATLLVFLATDLSATQAALGDLLSSKAERTFNRITIDSDTSTNDACLLTATGASGVTLKDAGPQFPEQLESLMLELAQSIIRDAEGATKFITVHIKGGKDEPTCLAVANAIANSPLVKTAIFAADANWGRLVMAIGKAPTTLDPNKIDIHLGQVCLMKAGAKNPSYQEAQGAAEMQNEDITITVDLHQGQAAATIWTSDLSHGYVSINADYRT